MVGTGLVVYPLIEADPGHRPPWNWAAIALGLVVLLGFGAHQRHSARTGRRPLVEPSLFASRMFPAALVTSTLFFAVMNGLMLTVVLHMQLGLGASTLTAGLTLLPWSVGLGLSSLIAGAYLVPRYGPRVMYAGLSLLLLGVLAAIAAYHASDPTAYPRPLRAALAIAGLGTGLFTTPFFTAALRPVSPQETGSAAGLLNAVQQLGGTLGVAVLGSVYLAGARSGVYADARSAVQHAFWVAAALLVATALSAALMAAPVGTSAAPLSTTRRRRPPPLKPPTVSSGPAARSPGAGGRMPGWNRSCMPPAKCWVSSCPIRSTWAAARVAPSCVVGRPPAAA